jgi:DNA sulfur modification protein DndD
VRGKVEKRTFDSFMNLHWDKQNYKDFSINETYTMSLKDPNGNERIHNIASGTKQVFLLSFISALAEVSGFRFPILIDTPLANTDNEQRENIATNLPNYLKGNQVILLVKDQEYTPKFRSLIKDRISQEFRLIKTGGRTEVKPWA